MHPRDIYFALILACLAIPAAAQQQACGPRELVVKSLQAGWGEVHQSEGLDKLGVTIEVWTNFASDTWTILATDPRGTACIIASGTAWQTKPLGVPS